jgi:hypothetical protein
MISKSSSLRISAEDALGHPYLKGKEVILSGPSQCSIDLDFQDLNDEELEKN